MRSWRLKICKKLEQVFELLLSDALIRVAIYFKAIMKIHFSRLPFARVLLRCAFVGLTFFFFGNVSQAQNQDDFGSWFWINTQGSLSPESNSESRLWWWFDGHLRYLTDWGQIGSFSQNRVFTGIGYNLNGLNKPRLEVGYLNQFLRRPGDVDPVNHVLSVNWFWSF